ncbi:mucolipin-2 [Puma concolor]|uniref:Mucolipin-2 n=1 Tax=Puma concolor TaxID=9696 RepID=A0A6P6I4G0_PUMCO|nr:mucolipin-2 [Puma concolor]
MLSGVEALDLPAWNGASGLSWGPRHRNAMAHLDSEVKEECLREDLKFYFMNPCEKYRARHQIPWKLGLQILKIAMVTTQIVFIPDMGPVLIVQSRNTDCVHLDLSTYPQEWKNSSFFRLEFYRLLQVEISFHLKGIDLQTIHSRELPDCYVFHNTITFDNKAHSGKIKIYFGSDAKIEECKDLNISGSIQKNTQYVLAFDAFVIVICLASLILCTRSIVLALRLRKRFLNFFLEKYKRHVCNADQWEFINGWYILVIISDLMTIIGSILKMEIKAKNLTNYDLCSILLGTSTLFVWVGVIRYLGYFQAYNVLILTMQASLPKVLRFCACAGMIYLGYTFCGWIVLGPYHDKFEDLNTVAECLFSLVNGDDMFATFAQIQQKSILVWLFSRLYLYSFISLFIYMILSLFIALITDSYDTIKKYQQNGFPETDLQEFLKECGSKEKYQKEASPFLSCICCLRRKGSDDHLVLMN